MDEFQTFNPENITDVLSLARDAELGVILATQDLAKLGDKDLQQTILANCNTYFLMKTNFPEQVTDLAGTLQRIEHSYQWAELEETGVGSGREQHSYHIPPNEVARLRPGQVFIINSRYVTHVQMPHVTANLVIDPQAEAPNHRVVIKRKRHVEEQLGEEFEV